MPIPPRSTGSNTYFVTSATANRRPLFQLDANAALFIETLQHYRHTGHFKLHAFVVMPDHIHLLLTPLEITLERAIGLIKGGFSHRLHSKLPVWQPSFTQHRIRDRQDFLTRLHYIHDNPVRARLATQFNQYPHSSAFRLPPSAQTQNQTLAPNQLKPPSHVDHSPYQPAPRLPQPIP
jgi:putative transposase